MMEFSSGLLATLLLLLVVVNGCSAENGIVSDPIVAVDSETRQVGPCYAVPPNSDTKHVVLPAGLAPPLLWAQPTFDDSGWAETAFPLGFDVTCPGLMALGPLGGTWPLGTKILTRNRFWLNTYIPTALTVKLTYDNRAKLYVNGDLLHPGTIKTECLEYETPLYVSFIVDNLVPGWNVIALEGNDSFDSQSWLNFEAEYVCDTEDSPPMTADLCCLIEEPTKVWYGGGQGPNWKKLGYDDSGWDNSMYPLGESVMCTELLPYTLNGSFPRVSHPKARNIFQVESMPYSATLEVIVDSRAKVWMNGNNFILDTGVQDTCPEVSTVHVVNVTCRLQHGNNVISLRAWNYPSKCQSFLKVKITHSSPAMSTPVLASFPGNDTGSKIKQRMSLLATFFSFGPFAHHAGSSRLVRTCDTTSVNPRSSECVSA